MEKRVNVLTRLHYILTAKQKISGIMVLLMSIIGAAFETLGVSVIIPLVQSMMDAGKLMRIESVQTLCDWFKIESEKEFIILLGIGVISLYIVKNIYMCIFANIRAKYTYRIQKELSVKMMKAYMDHDYVFFRKVNTGEVIRGIKTDASNFSSMLLNGLRLLSEGLTILAISIFILITDPQIAICVVILSTVCVFMMVGILKKLVEKAGVCFWKSDSISNSILLQVFEGIKEVMVMQRKRFFVERYEKNCEISQKAAAEQVVLSEIPAYIIEAICVTSMLLVVCLKVVTNSDIATFIPQLAAFAIAAFRLLPSLGKVSNAVNTFLFYIPSLNSIYNTLQEVCKKDCVDENEYDKSYVKITGFKNQLELLNINWHYPDSDKMVLDGINITIKRGESVAFIGPSGAGKTTLSDIILGLFKPQKGQVLIDGIPISKIENWAYIIGYVPQSVYLIDDTIRNNVAFGVPEEEISDEKVWEALKKAQLMETVEKFPEGLNTLVGERGTRFSGGQQQRIAIARALYNDPDILVLDEATSALDAETEKAVMESIESLQGLKTMIIIAHRLSTIKNCDTIYKIENGESTKVEKEVIYSTNN